MTSARSVSRADARPAAEDLEKSVGIPKKDAFSVQGTTNEHYDRFRNIEISIGTNFHLKQTTFIFCIKFAHISHLKQDKWTLPSNSAYSTLGNNVYAKQAVFS